jgi:hypothetical protein
VRRLCELYPGISLKLRKKHGKTSVRVVEKCPDIPVAVAHYTFTHKQYTEQHNERHRTTQSEHRTTQHLINNGGGFYTFSSTWIDSMPLMINDFI